MISLDVDTSENAAQLRAFADRNGFSWKFAVAPREMLAALQQTYGTQFLTPTAEPMFFVSPAQRPSKGSFGRRDAGTMRSLVAANDTAVMRARLEAFVRPVTFAQSRRVA